MQNCNEIVHSCLQLYKTFITGNLLHNFNDQHCYKLRITNGRCYTLQSGENLTLKLEGVGLIETFRVGSVVDKSHKYMYVTVHDIKRIKHH